MGGDPISGGAGWAGAGLLGMVLGWLLLVHLPAKDKQIMQLVADFRAEMKEAREAFTAALGKLNQNARRPP